MLLACTKKIKKSDLNQKSLIFLIKKIIFSNPAGHEHENGQGPMSTAAF